MPWHMSGSQRASCREHFCPSNMRALGTELRSSVLAVSTFIHPLTYLSSIWQVSHYISIIC